MSEKKEILSLISKKPDKMTGEQTNKRVLGGQKEMAVVKELIRTEENGAISFGDYELAQKSKLSDYQHQGDMYKVKTFKEITKLERNGMFVYESVPGTAVFDLTQNGNQMDFHVEGPEDAQITVEMEPDTEYEVFIEQASTGKMKTNFPSAWNLEMLQE